MAPLQRNLLSHTAAWLAVVLVSVSALAQGTRPRRVAEAPSDDVALEGAEIEVPVVVADRSGRYVPGLRRADFEIDEDGRPQEITLFRDDRVPIHVAVVMDTSSSTRDSLGDIQEAAVAFTEQLLPGDEILIVSFDGDVRIDQRFTNDRGRLARAIRKTETRSGTRLYDAVYRTLHDEMRHVDGRKALVLLTDGDDTRSDRSEEDALAALDETDVVAYAIRYPGSGGFGRVLHMPGSSKNKKKDSGWHIPKLPGVPRIPGVNWPLAPSKGGGSHGDFLDELASRSGGDVYSAGAISDLDSLFGRIAEELRHVYLLGFAPSNPVANGGFRSITVRVPARPDLVVRHRLGYDAGAYRTP